MEEGATLFCHQATNSQDTGIARRDVRRGRTWDSAGKSVHGTFCAMGGEGGVSRYPLRKERGEGKRTTGRIRNLSKNNLLMKGKREKIDPTGLARASNFHRASGLKEKNHLTPTGNRGGIVKGVIKFLRKKKGIASRGKKIRGSC